MSAQPVLSVIIPAFNEGGVIGRNLGMVDQYLKGLGVDYEIVVVNDGSKDNTLMEISYLALDRLKILSYENNRGKGFAVYEGMRLSQGQYRLFMDADLSTDLNEIKNFLQRMRLGDVDILIGDRNTVGVLKQERPALRALLGRSFAQLSSMMLGFSLRDFTCGFKMFSALAAQEVFKHQHIWGWAFDSELMFIAHQKNLRVQGLPVRWRHEGNSKVNVLSSIANSLVELVKIRYYNFKGYYKD